MARRGRPTKFTVELGDEVLKAVSAGALMQDAAEFAGIAKSTLYAWIEEGRQDGADPEIAEFSNAVTKARASGKVTALAHIRNAMRRNWKAAAWWLSVADPKHYGPKIRVTLEQEYTDALARLRQALPEDAYEKALAAIVEGESGEGAAEDPEGTGGETAH